MFRRLTRSARARRAQSTPRCLCHDRALTLETLKDGRLLAVNIFTDVMAGGDTITGSAGLGAKLARNGSRLFRVAV